MKISVIIPCKNEKETISKTIESVLSQTYSDYEIIVLDGNSTDGTLEILESYKNKITLFKGEEDGIYQAMNKGIANAKGDILYFLNANDSIYSNDVFEKIIGAFAIQGADFIYGDTNFQTEGKNILVSHKDFYSKFVWAYRNINHQSTFYKKWLFEKYGNYDCENFKILADVDFTTKIAIQKNVKKYYFPLIVANYNHEGVSSYKNPENMKLSKKEKEQITKKYLQFEHVAFVLYNLIFSLINNKITAKIKEQKGLDGVYEFRNFKRKIGEIFFWWMRKI